MMGNLTGMRMQQLQIMKMIWIGKSNKPLMARMQQAWMGGTLEHLESLKASFVLVYVLAF